MAWYMVAFHPICHIPHALAVGRSGHIPLFKVEIEYVLFSCMLLKTSKETVCICVCLDELKLMMASLLPLWLC